MGGVISILTMAVMVCLCSFTDISIILAPTRNCNVVRRSVILPSMLILLCAGSFLTGAEGGSVTGTDTTGAAIIGLCALSAVAAGRLVSVYRPALWALTGSIAGYEIFRSGDFGGLWDWLLAAAVSIALAVLTGAVLCRIIALVCRNSRKHYLVQVWNLGIITTVAAALMLVAVGANISLVWRELPLASGGHSVTAIAMAAGLILALPFLGNSINRLSEKHFDVNYDVILSVVCTVGIVCALLSSETVTGWIHCKASVLSPGILAFAALGGCSIVKRQDYMSGQEVAKLSLVSICVPLIALTLSYLTFSLLNGGAADGVFVKMLVLSLVLTVLLFSSVIASLYNRSRHSGQALRDQEEQINENRHTLNSLEVKNMTIENEHLRNQLDLKRQELMSIAMNITEQKEFIEKLNAMVKEAQLIADPKEKDRALHEISTQLSLRMNFDNEIDSFYTQVEQLHKDFTTRLYEKYPQLTKQERRLTVLLRLGFSTKYIAALMNIAPKSAEICRHRLRTKFGLDRKQNLTDFIKNI